MTTRKANKGRKAETEKIDQGKPVSIQDGASRIYAAMDRRRRDDGAEFFCLKDGTPEWMRDVVHAGHGDRMPNDTDYEAVRDVCSELSDYTGDDIESEGLEGLEPSVYTADLTRWLASHIDMVGYLTQALEEFGDFNDGFRLLAMANKLYLDEVGAAVVQALAGLV